MPLGQIIDIYTSSDNLNQLIRDLPHFCIGFDASNKPNDKQFEYLTNEIESELGHLNISIKGTDGNIFWSKVPEHAPVHSFVKRFEAEKGLPGIKFLMKHLYE